MALTNSQNISLGQAEQPSSSDLPAIPPTLANKANKLKFSRADSLVFTCVCIWAFNVPFVKSTLVYFQPLETSLMRFFTAGLFFAIYVQLKEGSLAVKKRDLPLLIGAGLMGILINQVFFVYALKNTSSSEVSLLMAATPTFATLLAWLFGQEKIRFNYWLSLPLAIVGVSLIVLSAPGAHLSGNLFGDFLALLTAGSWALYTVMMKPLVKKYSPSLISAYVLLSGSIALLPFGIGQFDFSKFGDVPLNIWLTLGYCTFGAVVLTNILWYTGIRDLGAPRTAFYAYLQPFVGVFAAFLILGETIVWWQIVGGFFIVGSMILYRIQFSSRKPVMETPKNEILSSETAAEPN